LADELDFGPHRAPQWLAELLKPGSSELEHWKNHNKLYEPSIDLDHFRIQVRGTCSDTRIMPKLRHEIEEPSRQDIQKVFLNRGLKQQIGNRTFLLWDMTRYEGEAFKEELRQKQRELEEELEKQRKLEGMRDSMVHMIVHDLRAPLTAVFNYLDLVREQEAGFISPESTQNLNLAMKASRWMVQMVNVLLDASKIESGEMLLRITECDAGEVLSDAIDAIRSLADEKNVLFEPDHVRVAIDRDVIARVVQNLVSNALKLTPSGGEVRVSLHSTHHVLRVEVTDKGPGIASKYYDKIFEKFGQLDASVRQSIPTSGLGLYFCRLAIEAHGGRIGVESEVGQGSTFWFELPLRGVGPRAPRPM
jgi:signal transduction histidine kinase